MKIIASDFDGTITFDSANMLETNKRAIAEWRSHGNLFGIVTGRGAESICSELEHRDIQCDFILADNGSLCLYNGEVLFEEKIDVAAGAQIMQTVFGFGCEMLGYDCGTKPHRQIYSDDGQFAEFLGNASYTQFNTVCHGDTVEAAYDATMRLSKIISEKHGDLLNPLPNGFCLDICRAGCDKGTGIAKLAEILSISHDCIYTVGDNFNDLAMLERFNSFAMNNACDEVKKHASIGATLSVSSMIDRLLDGQI